MKRLIGPAWLVVLAAVIAILSIPESREIFKTVTRSYPYTMGFLKIAILGTMAVILGAILGFAKKRARSDTVQSS